MKYIGRQTPLLIKANADSYPIRYVSGIHLDRISFNVNGSINKYWKLVIYSGNYDDDDEIWEEQDLIRMYLDYPRIKSGIRFHKSSEHKTGCIYKFTLNSHLDMSLHLLKGVKIVTGYRTTTVSNKSAVIASGFHNGNFFRERLKEFETTALSRLI
jgi:hypothetical protein